MSLLKQKKLYYKKKKRITSLLEKVDSLDLNIKINILQKVIILLNSNLDKNKSKLKKKYITNKNSLDRVYEKIFDEITSLGYPFTKHKKDPNSSVYKQSIEYIKTYYKKHRGNLINIFKLAHECFSDPRFKYNPKSIPLPEFFKYYSNTIRFNPHLVNYTRSWFKEFEKGQDHIEKTFMRKIKDDNPKLTKQFIKIWQEYKKEEINQIEHKRVIIFVRYSKEFSDNNDLSTNTIFNVVKTYLSETNFIENMNYFNSQSFWVQVLPDLLIKYRIFNNKRQIKYLEF